MVYLGLMNVLGLPNEIILEILKNCSYIEVIAISQTCKRFNKISNSEAVWSYLSSRDYDIPVTSCGPQLSYQFAYKKLKKCFQDFEDLIGMHVLTYLTRGMIEAKFVNGNLLGLLWTYTNIPCGEVLESIPLFKVCQCPISGEVTAFCLLSEKLHKSSLIKDRVTENYVYSCEVIEDFFKSMKGISVMDEKHLLLQSCWYNFTSSKSYPGVELQPMLLPSRLAIPPEILLEGGRIPQQIIESGLFKGVGELVRGQIVFFHYKNENELHGSKIIGDFMDIDHDPFVEPCIKVFLKYSFTLKKELSLQDLDAIEMQMNKEIGSLSDLPESAFCSSFPSKSLSVTLPSSCKARYFGMFRQISNFKPVFNKIHFIVFDNDTIALQKFDGRNEFCIFQRYKHSFTDVL